RCDGTSGRVVRVTRLHEYEPFAPGTALRDRQQVGEESRRQVAEKSHVRLPWRHAGTGCVFGGGGLMEPAESLLLRRTESSPRAVAREHHVEADALATRHLDCRQV